MSSEGRSQRFAAAVLLAFQNAGHATDQEVASAGGPSTTTLTKLRKAATEGVLMKTPRNDTFRRIDRAAGWPPGSARAIWEGGPVPEKTTSQSRTAVYLDTDVLLKLANRAKLQEIARGEKPLTYADLDPTVQALAAQVLALEARVDALQRALPRAGLRTVDADPDASIYVDEAAYDPENDPNRG